MCNVSYPESILFSWRERPVEKRVMHVFSVRKQDHSQILSIHFVDLGPAANSPVFLYHFANWMFDRSENPLYPDYGSIRSRAHRQEYEVNFTGESLPGDVAHCKP